MSGCTAADQIAAAGLRSLCRRYSAGPTLFMPGAGNGQTRAAAASSTRLAALPPLTEDAILAWADGHRTQTGAWPNENSGPILDAPGETWYNINASIREGFQELPGGSTLSRLLAEGRGVPNNWGGFRR